MLSPNQFGAIGDAVRRSPLGAGEQKRFCPLLGLRPKGGAAREKSYGEAAGTAPHICLQTMRISE